LPSSPNKQALGAIKPSTSLWHHRLGHAASRVKQVLDKHRLPFHDSNKNRICDACQQGKSHQLPYPKSTSVSTSPMDLVFSDVWGPAPTSIGNHNYYVSFIDNFSKFTWIFYYDTNPKFSSVSIISRILSSANLVEKSGLSRRIGEGSIKHYIRFFSALGFPILSRILMPTNKMERQSANIDILLTWDSRFLLMPPYHLNFGMKHSLQPYTLLIVSHPRSLMIKHLLSVSLVKHQIIPSFAFLDVLCGQIYDHIIHENYNFDPSSAYFLATAPFTKATSV
jgi:hypothetical protein